MLLLFANLNVLDLENPKMSSLDKVRRFFSLDSPKQILVLDESGRMKTLDKPQQVKSLDFPRRLVQILVALWLL